MMAFFNSVGILGCFGVFFYAWQVLQKIQELYMEQAFESTYFYNPGNVLYVGMLNIALNGAFFMVFVALAYGSIHIGNLVKIKTTTTKVMAIIGIVISSLFLIYNIAIIAASGDISFEITYVIWVVFALLSLGLGIVLLIQAIKQLNRINRKPKKDDRILDLEIE